ncbi:MAG: [FeFe] hydrogenase H-cluster radical SAM maturase HydE [Bacteroidales bacterium]|nr:[FeFe] hydrogenase H-cluster radical SAM maturase HydE [Bacteroidales bacterium]
MRDKGHWTRDKLQEQQQWQYLDVTLRKSDLNHDDIVYLLGLQGAEKTRLFEYSSGVKEKNVGNKVYFRGLIEFSNVCLKNCLYCGIRRGNVLVNRYNLHMDEILAAARFAFENNYGSLVLQSGELETGNFVRQVEKILREIHRISGGKLRITLSCGEQEKDTYRRWHDSGAHRYLLRIESSNPELYRKLHPQDGLHSYQRRLDCLYSLQNTGYQVGTGVMIGLPFQTLHDLAGDLLFMKQFDIDMVGMGPYLEHEHTPLYAFRDQLLPVEERLQLTLKMIAVLRMLLKDINIAATTALQAIDKLGREKAIQVGANVIMPNITPGRYRDDYLLYQNKPCTDENPEDCMSCLNARIALTNNEIAYGEWGDSEHFRKKGTRDKGRGTSQP